MKNLLKTLFLFVALFAFMQGVWAQTFITDVMIISGNQSQTDGYKTQYQNEGWTVIDNDLNAGAGGNFIYLLYKTNESSGSSGTAVTGFYLKTGNDDHPNTITQDGHTYSLVPAVGAYDLNYGAGGAYIYLYYTKEAFSPSRVVTGIYFNSNSNGALGANGNTSSGFDLNSGAGGDYIYMHVVTITTDDIIDVYTEAQLREAVMLNDANIRMMADINISSEVEINNNRTVTLDLNGHTLDRGLSSATNYGHALKVISGSTLTINDASGDNSGVIKGAYTGQGGGIRNYGTIIINGGTIRDNHSGTKGGGINNHNGASLTINGGVITNNEAQDGAGIYNEATGTITINNCSIIGNTTNKYGGGGITNYGTLAFYGGTVSNNTAIQDGGGIWTDNSLTASGVTIEGNSALNGGGICINHGTADLTNVTISGNTSKDGGGIYVYSVGTLTFNSGSISDNTTTEYGGGGIANHGITTIIDGSITGNTALEYGGGIWSGKTLTLKGGTITNNHAGNCKLGDGVHFYGGTFNLEGNPQIYGNLKASGQPGTNVFLPSGKKITVSGAFTEGADVNFSMENYGVFTTGFKSYNTAHPVEIFTPDNATFYVTLDGEEACLNIDLSEVSYVDLSWNSVNHVVTSQVKTCTNFTKLEGSNSNSCTELGDGWYVVYKNVSYKKCLKMVGDVHLILVDGATLNVKDGIYIKKDKTFTVYGQEAGLGKIYAHPGSGPGIGGMQDVVAGHFVVKGGIIDAKAGSNKNAGIGGGKGNSGIQSITIYGGNIKAQGKDSGAGIGKGKNNNVWETVTIYGGNINAEGGDGAAGIGGGENRGNGEVIIWGGTILADGSNGAGIGGGFGGDQDMPITINGGTITASGNNCAAGIGGGRPDDEGPVWATVYGGEGGTITINGGTVIAHGGVFGGAGIGGGWLGSNGDITINGGFIMADTYKGCSSAAIGAGSGDQTGDIMITGGEIFASSYGYGAGIGGARYGDAGNIYINNAEVTAFSAFGAGIGGGGSEDDGDGGSGGNITIDGGSIYALSAGKGAGIGGGNDGNGGTITINDGYVKTVGGYCKYSFFSEHGPTFINLGYDINPIYSMAASALFTIIEELIHMGTFGGAGIGGGDEGNGGTVTINGGTVVTKGGRHTCSAIGRGNGGGGYGNISLYDNARVVLVADSTIQLASKREEICKYKQHVIIEPCTHEEATYIINDDVTHTICCPHCKTHGIFAHEIDEQGHCVCGIDMGVSTVTVYHVAEDGSGYVEGVSCIVANTKSFILPQVIDLEQLNFEGWVIGTPEQVGNSYIATENEIYYGEGHSYTVNGDVSFVAKYKNYWNGLGKGTGTDPFLIATTDDLDQLATRVNNGETYLGKCFRMTADLEYDGTENNYTRIGTNSSDISFFGTFDGGGHYISGININSTDEGQGVFGSLGGDPGHDWFGTIMNLTLKNSMITGTSMVGGIVGANRGIVRNCHVTDNVTIHVSSLDDDERAIGIGGIAGYNTKTILECTSAASITVAEGLSPVEWCGGVAGGSVVGSMDCIIASCLYTGNTIQGTSDKGAIVGFAATTPNYFNYYTTENLDGFGCDYLMSSLPNVYGHNRSYTISCAEGLALIDFRGVATGVNWGDWEQFYETDLDLDDNAVLEYNGVYYGAEGITVSFKFDIEAGHGLSEVYCNNTPLEPDEKGYYSFVMPASNVIITATSTLPTFTNEGNWEDLENWSYGIPTSGCDVIIAAPATINSDVKVGNIIFVEPGSITIADGGQLEHIYDVTATMQKEIVAYDDDNNNWYTIASPVNYDLPISGLVTESEYDLYRYHEPTHYWWNAKSSDHGFNTLGYLEGYLYANAENVRLSFTGNMKGTDNTVTVPLSFTSTSGSLKGFNLVGNPFTRRLTQYDAIKIGNDDLTTYLMAEENGELVPYTLAERPIEPGEGFFVQATEPGQDLVINYATRGEQAKGHPAYLRIEAGRDGAYGRAYVQMGSGNTLRKMKLSDNTPSVSVWHNGEDWAAVTIESATGELPVSFKATENGTYTISVSIEGLDMDYMHLIDNMTGVDTDLLQIPSYSFEAKVTDYESRFKLVFSTQVPEPVEGPDQPFVFISNGEIIVNGEGLLQVIDMTGRIIINRDGVHTISTNGMTPGVYVLRLINDEKVKTQKIVIQ